MIKYYEDIQFQIDIDAQEFLLNKANNDNELRQEIIEKNASMMQSINDGLESNIKRINEFKFANYFLLHNLA